MNALKLRLRFCLLAGMVSPVSAQSPFTSLQVPPQIQYQGRIATAAGGNWSGAEGYFVFALIHGTTILWNNWEGTASPSDLGAVSLGAGQVLTQPVNHGVFSIRLGEGSDINEQIPATVFFDTTSNAVRSGVKLAVWFSPDGGAFTRLGPDVEFSSVPFAMVAGVAEAVKERAVTTSMIADASVNSLKIADGSLAAADLSPSLQFASLMPVGAVVAFASVAAPPGWEICDAREVAFTDPKYAALFAVIGTRHGGGNSANTFKLPDYRGRFLRGVDDPDGAGGTPAANRDPDAAQRTVMSESGSAGGNVGSVQSDAFQNISGILDVTHGAVRSSPGASNGVFQNSSGFGGTTLDTPQYTTTADRGFIRFDASKSAGARTSTETRPQNAYVNYIIKL